MTIKKFLAPNITIIIVLSLFWAAGVDSVFKHDDEHTTNLKKYIMTQQRILQNYVDEVDISRLYQSSMRGFVKNMKDSTATLAGTPLDTTFQHREVSDLRESVNRFEEAYLYMGNNYPDENMTERTEDAIRGMFRTLDPHSIYIEPEQSEAIEEEFAGKFQGIGIEFNVIQDTITVVTPISGGPSDQLGIMSGDRIVEINDSSAIGFTNEQVRNSLRGPKDTKVDVTIKRPHVNRPLHFTITRDDIPLFTIDTSYMLDEKTGYIKINRFAATTHEEFMEAVKGLRDKGMERIVLDLRGNPGGYLSQAIAIAEEFFPRGTKLVSTKSRHQRFTSTYFSRRDGSLKNEPVIIMVNEGSASASEIVSGAVQDHDRGLIVGKRTFGKGLVQQQYDLADSSKIRVTISKYYTPAGRLIQKPYNEGREEYAYEIYRREQNAESDVSEFLSHVPDSLTFQTDAGRKVFGGGGIVPDHIVEEDTTQSAAVFNFMRQKRVGFNFVRHYLDNNGTGLREQWKDDFEAFRDQFELNEKDMDTLLSMLKDNKLAITDTVSKPEFTSDTLLIPPGHFEKVEWMQRGYVKAELARQIWGFKYYYPIINDTFDNAIAKVMNLWDEVSALRDYAATHGASSGGE